MNRMRILLWLGLVILTLASGTVIQNCTHNSFLSNYIAQFSSPGCLDQNLLFSNFQYTRLTSAALPASSILATRPPDNDPLRGLSFFGPGWFLNPPKSPAISVLTYTVTSQAGALLSGSVLNLSGAYGPVSITEVCFSGCSPGMLLLGTSGYPYLTSSFAPVQSINVMTVIGLRKTATLSSLSQL